MTCCHVGHSIANMFTTAKRRAARFQKFTKLKTMEPKKNSKYDVHRCRSTIFNFSLVITLLVVITAFNWSAETDKRIVRNGSEVSQQIEQLVVPVVYETKKEVLTPKPIPKSEPKPSLESINIKAVSDAKAVDEIAPGVIDQNHNPMIEIPLMVLESPEIITDTVFRVVEKMPEPKGGWETFVKTLTKNMKYPRQAQRSNVMGKVFVGFTVDENGVLRDFSIEGGIGFGCDEEAARVIALTKWNPGKQRGRPVKVRLVQPVTFSLGTP